MTKSLHPLHRALVAPILIAAATASMLVAAIAADDIDWNRARELYEKSQRGESLTADEQSYLERAKQAKMKEQAAGQPGPQNTGGIDMQRAKELFEKSQRGEQLTPDEQSYLDRAKQMRDQRMKAAGDAQGIDWEKARAFFQKSQSGETLTPDEQAYLDKAKAARAAADGGGQPAGGAPGAAGTDMQRAKAL